MHVHRPTDRGGAITDKYFQTYLELFFVHNVSTKSVFAPYGMSPRLFLTHKSYLRAGFCVQANVIHRLLVRDPDTIPQGGDGVDRTLFLRKVTEEALRLTRCAR